MEFARTFDRIWYTTIYLLIYTVNTIHSKAEISTALGIVEGSTFPAPIAVAAETFVDLIKHGNIFIDKSAIIKELLQTEAVVTEATLKLFVRPNGWGKSINLNLIKIFCEIHVDPNTHEIIPNHQTSGYQLFEYGEVALENGTIRKLRDTLLVSADRMFMLKHQGQYIVVHINLGGLKAKNLVDLKKTVAARARLAFKMYNFDHIATALGADSHLIDEMARRIRAEKNDWTSFPVICNLLKKYYKHEIIVLIEDYDESLIELMGSSAPNKLQTVNQFYDFYGGFFKMLEENKFYKRVIVTGTTRMLFDNNLIADDIGDELIGEPLYLFHGFNEKEMGLIFDHLDIPAETRKEVTALYSGYQFNENERNVYNPLSVVKFLASRKLEYYWTPKRSIETIFAKTLSIPVFRYILLAFDVFSLRETKRPYNTNLIHKEYLVKYRLEKFVQYIEDPESIIKNENKTYVMLSYYANAALEMTQYLLRCNAYLTRSYDVPNLEVDARIRSKLLTFYSSHLKFKGKDNPSNSSLGVLCEKFRVFLLNNETKSEELNKAFMTFLGDLEEFNSSVTVQNSSQSGQDIRKIYAVSDVLNLMATYMNDFHVVHSGTVSRGEEGFAEGHMIFRHGIRGIIIHMTVGYLSVENTLVLTRKLVEYLRPFTAEEVKEGWSKRIGIHYQPDGNLRVLGTVERSRLL